MIQNIKLYTVLNSFGSGALLVKMWTRSGCYQATVPVPDATPDTMKKMKVTFSSIRQNFIGLNEEDWVSFDSFMDQLSSKGRGIEKSLSLGLSLACAKAATQNELWRIRGVKKYFPYIVGSVVLGKDWNEFVFVPYHERTVTDAFESLLEIWNIIGGELRDRGYLRGRSVRGAWLSDLGDLETLYFLDQIAKDWKMRLGINIGGDSMWDGKVYSYKKSKGSVVRKDPRSDEQLSLMSAITEQYKLWYIEDPFHSSDFMSHAYLSHKLADTLIAGGDLYKADLGRIKRGFKSKATKAISVNPMHLSTVSQLAEISEFARGNGLKIVLSRSDKETGDSWLSDLSVAFGADMLKLGVLGAANTSKFSRLLEIWEDVPSPKIGRTGSHG
jgi:enolase